MREVKKKGLSPVIASVLLILLVIFLAFIIFLWARGFISEQIEKFGKPIEKLCKSVDFKASLIQSSTGGEDTLEIVNRGNINIKSIEIKVSKEGNADVQGYDYLINSMDSIRKEISLRMADGTYPQKIEVFPVLIGNIQGKKVLRPYVCINNGQVVYQES